MQPALIFAFLLTSVSTFCGEPGLKWKVQIGKRSVSTPVVSDGAVYVGGADSSFKALSLETGKTLWEMRTQGPINSKALIAGKYVIFNGGDGQLYCILAREGKVRWTYAGDQEIRSDFADYFHSSPIMSGGIIYFGSGASMQAVDFETGKLLWKVSTGGVVHTTAAYHRGALFFGSFDGFVYSVDAKDGSLRWKFKTVGHRYFPKGEVQGNPFVFNNLVFVGARDFNVYALDADKGYCHWNKAFDKGWGLVTSVHDSVLYIGTADQRTLIAAHPQTGKEIWSKPMQFLQFGDFAFVADKIIFGNTMGKLIEIAADDGQSGWTFMTDGYRTNRTKYFKEDDSYRDDIYLIIKSNEQFLEVEYQLGGIFSAPVVSADNILVTSSEGTLYCLRVSSAG
ncbi:MAG: PQQ-binding-like beta-propeller repeat protein [Cyclobacteriaceae bacterium]